MKTVLIIGNGAAGMTCAIKCAESGCKVLLVSKMSAERSQSVMAVSGINAALNTKGEGDSVEEHFKDTMEGGCFINDEIAVKGLTYNAPQIVNWLADLGVSFTRDENGEIDLRVMGGHKKKRTAYAGICTGKQIVSSLNAICRKLASENKIIIKNGYSLISFLITKDKECLGGIFIDQEGKFEKIPADAVVIACGGPNKVFGKTTGSILNDGSCQGIALSQGVEFANLEMIQYHPTTVETKMKNMMISESAISEGGRLYTIRNEEKWYFMHDLIPKSKFLMSRYVVNRIIYKVCNEMNLGINKENKVYLDISDLPDNQIDEKFGEINYLCSNYLGIDIHKSPIPVYPGVNYFMGGIRTDYNHKTNIKRLFAAGECSCQYHGANRLSGNSLLGAVYGGMVCEENINKISEADKDIKEKISTKYLKMEIDKQKKWEKRKINEYTYTWKIEDMLSHIMNKAMGIVRNEEQLIDSYKELVNLRYMCKKLKCNYTKAKCLDAAIFLSQAMIKSAFERKESRGAHIRLDYPQMLPKFKKCTCLIFDGDDFKIEFKSSSKGGVLNGKSKYTKTEE